MYTEGVAEEISLDKLLGEMIGAVKAMMADPRGSGIQENRPLRVMLRRYARKYETSFRIENENNNNNFSDELDRKEQEELEQGARDRSRIEEMYGKQKQKSTSITFVDKRNPYAFSTESVFEKNDRQSSNINRASSPSRSPSRRRDRNNRRSGARGGRSKSPASEKSTTSDTESGLDAELAEDEKYRLVDPGLQRIALVGDGEAGMYFEQLQLLRYAFLSPSFGRFSEEALAKRGEQILRGVPRHLFLDFFAPLLTRTNERGPNDSLVAMLDFEATGVIPWTSLVKILVNRGKLSDASREPYSIGAPSGSHHKAMISAICIPSVGVSKGRSSSAWNFSASGLESANPDERGRPKGAWSRLPSSLNNVFYTGGLDGIVREWSYQLAPTGGFYPGSDVALCNTIVHHRSCHAYYAGADPSVSMRNSPYSINDITYLQSSKLLVAQSFGHVYNYQLKNTEDLVGRRVLHSVLRTENFHARAIKSDAWGPRTFMSDTGADSSCETANGKSLGRGCFQRAVEGSGFRRVIIAEKQAKAPPEEASSSYCVIPGENPIPAPILTLKEAKGDVVALCGLLHLAKYCRNSLFDSFVMGTNEGEVLLYSLAKGTEGRGTIAPDWRWNMLQGGLVFSISEVPTSDSILVIGNDQKGANFLDVVDVEKQMTKFRFLGGALCATSLRSAGGATGAVIENLLDARLPAGFRSKTQRRQVLSDHAVLDVDDFGTSYTRADYDADRGLLIASGFSKKAALYTDSLPEPIHILDDHNHRVVGCSFNLARYRMLVMTADKTLHIYDSRMNRKIQHDMDFALRSPVDEYSMAAFDKNNQLSIGCASTPVLFTPSIRSDSNNNNNATNSSADNTTGSSNTNNNNATNSALKNAVAGNFKADNNNKNASARPASSPVNRKKGTKNFSFASKNNNNNTNSGNNNTNTAEYDEAEQTKLTACVGCSQGSYLAVCMGNVTGSIRVYPAEHSTAYHLIEARRRHSLQHVATDLESERGKKLLHETTSSSINKNNKSSSRSKNEKSSTSTNVSASLVTVAKEPHMIFSAHSITDRCTHVAVDPSGGRRLAICVNSSVVHLINNYTGTTMYKVHLSRRDEEVTCLKLTEAVIASTQGITSQSMTSNKRGILCIGGSHGQLIVCLCDPPSSVSTDGVPTTPEDEYDPQMQIAGAAPPTVTSRSVVCNRRIVRPANNFNHNNNNNSHFGRNNANDGNDTASMFAAEDPVMFDITRGLRTCAIVNIVGGMSHAHSASLLVSTAAGDVYLLNFASINSSAKTATGAQQLNSSATIRRIVSYDCILSNFPSHLRPNYTQIAQEQMKFSETYPNFVNKMMKENNNNDNATNNMKSTSLPFSLGNASDGASMMLNAFDGGNFSRDANLVSAFDFSGTGASQNTGNKLNSRPHSSLPSSAQKRHVNFASTTTTGTLLQNFSGSSFLSQQSQMIVKSAPFQEFMKEQQQNSSSNNKRSSTRKAHSSSTPPDNNSPQDGALTKNESSLSNNVNDPQQQAHGSTYEDIFALDEAEKQRRMLVAKQKKLSDDALAAKTPAVYSLWLQSTVLASRQIESVVVLAPHSYVAVLFGDGIVSISFLSRSKVLPQVSFRAFHNSPTQKTHQQQQSNNHNNNHNNNKAIFARSMLYYTHENMLVIGDSSGALTFFDLTKFWIASKETLEGKQNILSSPNSVAMKKLQQQQLQIQSSPSSPSLLNNTATSLNSTLNNANKRHSTSSSTDAEDAGNEKDENSSPAPTSTSTTANNINVQVESNAKDNTKNPNSSSPINKNSSNAASSPLSSSSNKFGKSMSRLFGGSTVDPSRSSVSFADHQKKQKLDQDRKDQEEKEKSMRRDIKAEKKRKEREEREKAEEESDDPFPVRLLGSFTIARDVAITSLEMFKETLCLVSLVSNSAVVIIDLQRIAHNFRKRYLFLRKMKYEERLQDEKAANKLLMDEDDDDHDDATFAKTKREASSSSISDDENNADDAFDNLDASYASAVGSLIGAALDQNKRKESKSFTRSRRLSSSATQSFVRISLVLGDVSLFTDDERSILRSTLGFASSSNNNNNDDANNILQQQQQGSGRKQSLQAATAPMQSLFHSHTNQQPEASMSLKSAQMYKSQLKKELTAPDLLSAQTLGGTLGKDVEQFAASDVALLPGSEDKVGIVRSGDFEAAMIKQRKEYLERQQQADQNENSGNNNNNGASATGGSRKHERRKTQAEIKRNESISGMPSPSWDLVFVSGQEMMMNINRLNESNGEGDDYGINNNPLLKTSIATTNHENNNNPTHIFYSHRTFGGDGTFEDHAIEENSSHSNLTGLYGSSSPSHRPSPLRNQNTVVSQRLGSTSPAPPTSSLLHNNSFSGAGSSLFASGFINNNNSPSKSRKADIASSPVQSVLDVTLLTTPVNQPLCPPDVTNLASSFSTASPVINNKYNNNANTNNNSPFRHYHTKSVRIVTNDDIDDDDELRHEIGSRRQSQRNSSLVINRTKTNHIEDTDNNKLDDLGATANSVILDSTIPGRGSETNIVSNQHNSNCASSPLNSARKKSPPNNNNNNNNIQDPKCLSFYTPSASFRNHNNNTLSATRRMMLTNNNNNSSMAMSRTSINNNNQVNARFGTAAFANESSMLAATATLNAGRAATYAQYQMSPRQTVNYPTSNTSTNPNIQRMNSVPLRNSAMPELRDLDYHRVEFDEDDAVPGTFDEKNPFKELLKANSMRQLEQQRKQRALLRTGDGGSANADPTSTTESRRNARNASLRDRKNAVSSDLYCNNDDDDDENREAKDARDNRKNRRAVRLSTPDPYAEQVPPVTDANARARADMNRLLQLAPNEDDDGDTDPAPSRFAFTPATPPPPHMLGEHIVTTITGGGHNANNSQSLFSHLRQQQEDFELQQETRRNEHNEFLHRKFPLSRDEAIAEATAGDLDEAVIKGRLKRLYCSNRGFTPEAGAKKVNADGIVTTSGDVAEEVAARLLHVFGPAPSRPKSSPSKRDFIRHAERGSDQATTTKQNIINETAQTARAATLAHEEAMRISGGGLKKQIQPSRPQTGGSVGSHSARGNNNHNNNQNERQERQNRPMRQTPTSDKSLTEPPKIIYPYNVCARKLEKEDVRSFPGVPPSYTTTTTPTNNNNNKNNIISSSSNSRQNSQSPPTNSGRHQQKRRSLSPHNQLRYVNKSGPVFVASRYEPNIGTSQWAEKTKVLNDAVNRATESQIKVSRALRRRQIVKEAHQQQSTQQTDSSGGDNTSKQNKGFFAE